MELNKGIAVLALALSGMLRCLGVGDLVEQGGCVWGQLGEEKVDEGDAGADLPVT